MAIHDDVQFQLHLMNVSNKYSFKCLKLEWTMMQYACLEQLLVRALLCL